MLVYCRFLKVVPFDPSRLSERLLETRRKPIRGGFTTASLLSRVSKSLSERRDYL